MEVVDKIISNAALLDKPTIPTTQPTSAVPPITIPPAPVPEIVVRDAKIEVPAENPALSKPPSMVMDQEKKKRERNQKKEKATNH